MTAMELYNFLDANDIDYELVEIFDGVRLIRVVVEEDDTDSQEGDTD